MLDHPASRGSARRTLLALNGVLLCAFALRCINLTFQPLWFDEGWSVWFATADLPTMAARTAADIHPPFYYALLHGWIAIAGVDEFALRYLSVLAGVLTVACIYRVARTLLDETTALLSALLVAFAPLFVFYSQEIRMYGLVTLLGLVSTALFWKMTEDASSKADGRPSPLLLPYILVTSATMYTQYYGAFIPLFHCVYLLYAARTRRALVYPLLAFVSLFVLYLPWLVYVASQLTQYVANKIGEEKYPSLSLFDYVSRHLAAFSVGHLAGNVDWLAWLSLAFVALACTGAFARAPRPTRHSPSIFLLLYLLVPLAAGYLVQLRFPFAPPRMERLLLLAAPAFLMLTARGLTAVEWRVTRGARQLMRVWPPAALTVLVAASALSLVSFYLVPRYADQDYRPLAARVDALALPADVMLVVHPWQAGFMQAYLRAPLGLQMAADPAWGAADQAQLDAALADGRRIWLPAYHALGGILETAMENYLARHALLVEARWQETSLLSFYAPAPPLREGGSPATLGGLRIGALLTDAGQHPYEAGWGVIPVGFRAVEASNVKDSTHVSIRLSDPQGRVWASLDRELQTPAFGATRVWQAGLLVPAGTPPSIYYLTLLLYDAETQQPLGPELAVDDFSVVRPATPPQVAALPIRTPLAADWPTLSLLGYTLGDGPWRTGDTLHADLFWQARGATDPDEVTFLAIQDASGQILSRSDWTLFPRQSPMQPGDLRREPVDVLVPAALGAGAYQLVLLRERAGDDSRVRLSDGREQVALGAIQVVTRPHQFTPPALATAQDFRLGDVARITGSEWTLDAQGRLLTVRIAWQALGQTQESYRVFVHVTRLDSAQPLAQHDGLPANGAQPTTSWVTGEYIVDEHALTLPPDLPPGTYRVLAGLYVPRNGRRVPAFDAGGRESPNDAVEMFQFKVAIP